MFEQHIAAARQALSGGNLAACEILCRDVLQAEPDHPVAHALLGILAATVGEYGQAQDHFERALAADPGNEILRADLAKLRGIKPPPPAPNVTRYLLIKAWRFGFWADTAHVLGALLLAEITGRVPVIHWGSNSLFSDSSARDAFTQYFMPVSHVTLDDLQNLPGAKFFPAKWNAGNLADNEFNKWEGPGARAGVIYFLNRVEPVAVSDFYIGVYDVLPWIPVGHALHGKTLDEVYRFLIEKYLRPQPVVVKAVDDFITANLADAPFVAVHLRGSDKAIEDKDITANNTAILHALEHSDPSWRIFLLTDDARILAQMVARFGARIVATDCQRTDTDLGVHYSAEQDRVRGGLEMMADSYIALRADRFIGSAQSNVAAMIALLKDWPDGTCILVGRNQLAERKLPLFLFRF